MNVEALIADREASYRGEGTYRQPAVYNSVEELLVLREAGYLIGPDSRTVVEQKFAAHKDDPRYSESRPGEATARHWTSDEMGNLRRTYSQGEYVARIHQAFPVETDAIEFRRQNLELALSDPDMFGAWNEPMPAQEPDISGDVVAKLDDILRRREVLRSQFNQDPARIVEGEAVDDAIGSSNTDPDTSPPVR